MARNSIVTFDPFTDFLGFAQPGKVMQRDPFFGFAPVAASSIKVDVKDEGDKYEVTANFPGVDKNDIDVSYDDGILTLSYEKSEEKDDEEKKHDYKVRERFFESASRSFRIDGIDESAIDAKLDAGVLTVMLPKKTEQEAATKKIEIK